MNQEPNEQDETTPERVLEEFFTNGMGVGDHVGVPDYVTAPRQAGGNGRVRPKHQKRPFRGRKSKKQRAAEARAAQAQHDEQLLRGALTTFLQAAGDILLEQHGWEVEDIQSYMHQVRARIDQRVAETLAVQMGVATAKQQLAAGKELVNGTNGAAEDSDDQDSSAED